MNTPYFVVKEEKLDGQTALLMKALDEHWGNSAIGYSFKTNSLPYVVRHMLDKGCRAEVVSDDEYRLARAAGYPVSRIVYNGMLKSRETFLEAVEGGAIVNIDTARELDWLNDLKADKPYPVGLRVNCDVESEAPGETSGGQDGSRFGFSFENGALAAAKRKAEGSGKAYVAGLHLHVGSKTRSVNIYRSIARFAVRAADALGMEPEYIDVGGGFFGDMEGRPDFDAYLREICAILRPRFDAERVQLIVEPGMSLIGPAVDYVCSVIDVKDTPYHRFAVVDGSRTAVDPFFRKQGYFYEVVPSDGKDRPRIEKQWIVGFTCIENDRLLALENAPALNPGDSIVFHKVGAYTMCLSPLFIKYFPDVYVERQGALSLVRAHWAVEEYIQNSEWRPL